MEQKESHIVTSFDQELKELTALLIATNTDSIAMLKDAVALLDTLDEDKAQEIIEADDAIDRQEESISLFAVKLLALRQPMADDLRAIVSAIKIAGDIERIADYASNIATRIMGMRKKTPPPPSLTKLGRATLAMLNKTTELLKQPNASAAIHLWHQDDAIDLLYLNGFKEMVKKLASLSDDEIETEAFMQYIFIAKNFERVGDRITNISEAIYYQRKGNLLAHAIKNQ